MVIGNQASQNNNAHPYQERNYGQTFNGYTMNESLLPQLFVFPQRDLENCSDQRADRHQKHFQPERKRHQFAHRFTYYHQETGWQQHAQRTRQPGTEPPGGLPQCLIHPRPSQDAQINHEHGPHYHCNAKNMDGLNSWDGPAVMFLYEDAQKSGGEPLGKMFQVTLP